MIRKPDAKVFEDSTTVKAVRGAQLVVQEGGGSAVRATVNLWFGGMIVVSMMAALSGVFSGNPFGIATGVAWIAGGIYLLRRLFRSPTRNDAIEQIDECGLPLAPGPSFVAAAGAHETIQVRYWSKALFNKAATLAVLGIVVAVMTGVLAIFGIVLLGRGVLLAAAAFGSRDCLEVNRTTVTVHNLLGTKSMPLCDVETVIVHKFRKRRQDISCFVGSRKVIVIEGRIAGERRHLLVPYTLLGLTPAAAQSLCNEIVGRIPGAVPAPRQGLAARRDTPPALQPAPSSADTPEPTFDPDAIMARYQAEREQVTEASGLPRPAGVAAPGGFGRKGLVASADRAA